MALTIIAMAMSLVAGLVLGTWLQRQQERKLMLAELLTGEVQIGGCWFKVQGVEFPHRQHLGFVGKEGGDRC